MRSVKLPKRLYYFSSQRVSYHHPSTHIKFMSLYHTDDRYHFSSNFYVFVVPSIRRRPSDIRSDDLHADWKSTIPFRSIRHIPVTVTRWISSTLRHRQPVTVTRLENSTLGKAQTASKWQFWMHFVPKAARGKICKNPPKRPISELSFAISALSHVGSTRHRSR
jgi:hypothetical protein